MEPVAASLTHSAGFAYATTVALLLNTYSSSFFSTYYLVQRGPSWTYCIKVVFMLFKAKPGPCFSTRGCFTLVRNCERSKEASAAQIDSLRQQGNAPTLNSMRMTP